MAAAEVEQEDRHSAIMLAALELVAEVGYERMTMDGIAARARSSKATMYRRWDSKAALVTDALQCRAHAEMPQPDTGELRTDLIAGLGTLAEVMRNEDLGLLTGMISAMRADPEFARLLRESVFAKKRAEARAWAAAAVARGELSPDADLDLAHEIAMSLVFARIAVTGEVVDDAFVVRVVDEVLLPVLTRVPSPATP